MSPSVGFVGRFELKKGTALRSDQPTAVLSPLAGKYSGDCNSSYDGSRLRAIELVPSRLTFLNQIPAEAALNVINYVGTTACSHRGGSAAHVCGSFQPGMYNFYTGELRLYDDVQSVWT